MTSVDQVGQSQQIMEQELQDQIAGAGAEPSYLVSENFIPAEIEATDAATISGPPLASTQAKAALSAGNLEQVDEEQYLENSTEYHLAVDTGKVEDSDIVKLQNGSDKIDAENPDVNELVDQILEEAGLSEKPAGMTDEEYQQAVAEAIYNWLLQNWQYAQDLGADYWQSVTESLGLSGDCEDFAILLASMLITAGLDPDNVAVIVNAKGDHAYVAVEIDGRVYTLDNGNFEETNYGSLNELLNDETKVGAWFTRNSQGINNQDLDIETANDTQGTSGGSGEGGAIDSINNLDGQATSDVLGFDESDYKTRNSDGYWEPDTEALFAWQKRVMARANALAALLIALSNKAECRKIVDENFTGVPIEESSQSYKEAYARKIGFLMKIVRTAIGKLLQQINAENKRIFEERMEEIKANNEGSGADTENFFTGGNREIETTQMALEETTRYLETTRRALAAMQQMINELIQWLVSTMTKDDLSALGTIKQLRNFSAKLDELNQRVDEKLEEARAEVEELSDAQTGGWLGMVGSFLGAGIVGIGIWAIVANCSDDESFADDVPYMDDVDIEAMIDDYRGAMTAMQNAQRMALSLKLFKKDLYNTVKQEFTGLSGIGTNAEMLMSSTESTLGLSISVFDMTASQMMLKTSLHNSAVKTLNNLQQLRKAQPIRLLSLAASAIMLGLSIAVTVMTGGAGAPLIVAALAAGFAIVKGAADAFAISVATDVKGYDPVRPQYDPAGENTGPGTTALEALENIEATQEANMAASTNTGSVIGQSADEYYYFDALKFATYEAKQNMLNNLIRCLFSVMKNIRDLKRLVKAEMTGNSYSDSGESLLQNSVENVILHRQMILSAIKFQHSEIIAARNIERQRDLGQEKAWGNFGATLGGAVAGAFLGGFLGGPAAAMIGMSIGSSLFSSVYQLLANVFDHYYDMDLTSPSQDQLAKLLQKQGGKSLEAKLDQAELEAYTALLNSGLVDAGDGYFAVDFGLVADIYSRLGQIYAIKEALAKARALKSELRKIVKQEMTGIMLGKSGDLIQAVNSANFRNAMSLANNIVRFLTQKAEIRNRARDAEKALSLSAVTAGINVVLSVVGFGALGSANAAANAYAGVVPGLMGLSNSAASLVSSLQTMSSDLGKYDNYDVKAHVDKTGAVTNNSARIDDKLDQLKYQIMLEMNSEMMTTLNGSYHTVSAGSAGLSTAMKGVFNIQEALATARSILSAARDEVKARFTGKRVGGVTYGKESIESYKQIALQILDSLKEALKVITNRYNRMEQAERQAWMTGISALISLTSVIVACVGADAKAEKNENMSQNMTNSRAQGAYPDQPNPADVETQPAEQAANGEAGRPGVVSGLPGGSVGPAGAGVELANTSATAEQTAQAQRSDGASDDQAAGHNRSNAELQKIEATCNKISALLTALDLVVKIVLPIIMDAPDGGMAYSHEDRESAEASRKSNKGEAEESAQNNNVFGSMDRMDASVDTSDFIIADVQNHSQASAMVTQRFHQINLSVVNLVSKLPETIRSFVKNDGQGAYLSPEGQEVCDLARSGNVETAAQNIMSSPEGASVKISALGYMAAHGSPVERQQAVNVLARVEQLSDGQMGMEQIHQRAEAALAAAQAQPEVQQAQTRTAATPEQTPTTSRTQALLEQASRIEQAIQAKSSELRQLVDPEEAQLQQAMAVDSDAQVRETNGLVQQANAETVADPRQLLQSLVAQRNALVAEQASVSQQLNALQEQLPEVRAEVQQLATDINTRVQGMRDYATRMSQEIEQLEALENRTPEQQARLETLTGQRQQVLNSVSALEAGRDQLGGRVTQIEEQITALQGRRQQLNAQIADLNRSITQMQRRIDSQAAPEEPAAQAQVAEGGGALNALANFLGLRGRSRVTAHHDDRIDQQMVDGGVGEVNRADDGEVLLAISRMGLGNSRSYHDQYRDASDAEQLFRDRGAVSGVSGAGVA